MCYSVIAPKKGIIFSTIICAVLCNESDSQLWCNFGEILFPRLNRHRSVHFVVRSGVSEAVVDLGIGPKRLC